MEIFSDPTDVKMIPPSQVDTMGHLLVVDDDEAVSEMIREYLSGEGFQVSVAGDGEAMRRILAETPVELIILDLMLPGEDGLALARYLREQSNAGIIIVSGRTDTVDRIIGLEMGSDDYLAKPFHLRELLARVKSVLRRVRARPEAGEPGPRTCVRFAGWTLDLACRALYAPGGEEVRLTAGEFDLLAAFVDRPNQVLSRDRLLDQVRNREAGPFDRTIDVQVGRLRRKLADSSDKPQLIKTVRGAGYIFTPVVEAVAPPPHAASAA